MPSFSYDFAGFGVINATSIAASGAITAGTTVTAGTGLTVTTGGLTVSAGRTTSAGFTSSIAGTGTLPAYNWSADTNNGMYYSGAADRWELAAGGADVWSVRTALAVAYVPFSASSTSNLGGAVTLGSNITLNAGYIDMAEIAAPSAPAANVGRIYVLDAAAKSRLASLFPTGVQQNITTEP